MIKILNEKYDIQQLSIKIKSIQLWINKIVNIHTLIVQVTCEAMDIS